MPKHLCYLKNNNKKIWLDLWGRSVQTSSLKELLNSTLGFSLNKAHIRQTSYNRDEIEKRRTRHGEGFINKSPAAHFVLTSSFCFSQFCGFRGWSRPSSLWFLVHLFPLSLGLVSSFSCCSWLFPEPEMHTHVSLLFASLPLKDIQ